MRWPELADLMENYALRLEEVRALNQETASPLKEELLTLLKPD